MVVRLYGLALAELEEAVDFFTTREEAEQALDAVLADEPTWSERVWIEAIEFDVSLQ